MRLQLHKTREELAFAPIAMPSAVLPGTALDGVQCVRRVIDAVTGELLQRDTAIWLSLPPGTDTGGRAAAVRWASRSRPERPVARGHYRTVQGAPRIDPISSLPVELDTDGAVLGTQHLSAYEAATAPPGIPAAAIRDPNAFLRDPLQQGRASERITSTTILTVGRRESATESAGRGDPPLRLASEAKHWEATFWIEAITGAPPDNTRSLRLQHSERSVRSVGGVGWPEISVATLWKREQRSSQSPRPRISIRRR